MKINLSYLITILAAAVLGVGCASTSDISEPSVNDPIKKGLVGYYPFNGNANDESGNGNDGQVKGATLARDRHLNVDSAYEFATSNSYIDILGSDTLKPKKFTLSTWVYLSQEGIDNHWSVFHKLECIQWAIDNAGKYGVKNLFGINKGRRPDWENVGYNGRIPAEEWFMYTATYDGSALKQYLNSVEICSLDYPGTVPHKKGDWLRIGGAQQSKNKEFMKLDEFRIYNRALSVEELKNIYDLEKPKK